MGVSEGVYSSTL